MIIGLTGGIGTGKSTVVKMFSKFENIATYVADDEAKKLINSSEKIKEEIISLFGNSAYKNGILDRKFISEKVFRNKEKLNSLNKIVHPEVRKHFIDFKNKNKNKSYIIYEVAILFEAKSDIFCDKVISIYANKKDRLKRIIERDNVSISDIENRMENQWNENKKHLLSNYVIYNNNIEDTHLQVLKIHNILTEYR